MLDFRLAAPLVLAVLPCFWDRDTLATEAAGAPGVVEVLAGRFDRFPDLYYEMRLERVAAELVESPDRLDLYDDAAVACDRIGRGGDAIGWMGRKREVLDALSASGAADTHHEYTYLANLGTIHVHRWLRAGRDRNDLADVERSSDLIAAAIELNPDAHFGRERYQLLAIEALLDPPNAEEDETTSNFLALAVERRGGEFWRHGGFEAAGYGDALEGLTGLVHLGAAWNSSMIFGAIEDVLYARQDTSLARIANRRVHEIGQRDPSSLRPWIDDPSVLEGGYEGLYDSQLALVDGWYEDARAAADRWHAAREAYMLERLETGRHPDVDPAFWDEWAEVHPLPRFPGRSPMTWLHEHANTIFLAIVAGVLLLVLWGLWAVVRSIVRGPREAGTGA